MGLIAGLRQSESGMPSALNSASPHASPAAVVLTPAAQVRKVVTAPSCAGGVGRPAAAAASLRQVASFEGSPPSTSVQLAGGFVRPASGFAAAMPDVAAFDPVDAELEAAGVVFAAGLSAADGAALGEGLALGASDAARVLIGFVEPLDESAYAGTATAARLVAIRAAAKACLGRTKSSTTM
jgi:hypothetical protein